MDSLINDFRYAARRLLHSPGFTIAAALTLGLGIGANTTIFTLVNAILLRPPAEVAAPDRLVRIFTSDFSGPAFGGSSVPDFEDFRKEKEIFEDVLLFTPASIGVGEPDAMEPAGLEIVSGNYFRVLGVRPAHGRFFTDDEGRPGASPVAVISQALFERRFGGDRSALGGTIPLNGRAVTLVGVAPAGFTGAMRPLVQEVWIPLPAGVIIGQGPQDLTQRGSRGVRLIARLAPGITIERAQSRMNVLAGQLFATYPDLWVDLSGKARRITMVSERDSRVPPEIRGPALGFIALLLSTVGMLLLVCCANVASLMLARSAARGREIGIRLSLGATRRRLVQQLVTESTLIALIGGAVGLVLAFWATHALVAFQLSVIPVPIGLDLSLDTPVLAFTAVASLGTGIIFGLAPALRVTRPSIVSVLKSDGAMVDLGDRRLSLQNILVVAQVAISVILLVSALLFVRALRNAASIDPGFQVDHLLVANTGPRPGSEGGVLRDAVLLDAQTRIAALPGVEAVTWADVTPLSGEASRTSIGVEGYEPRQGEDMEFHFNIVGPRFFETMGIPLVRGRGFTETDRTGTPEVIIVNEAFARRFWPGADPLGKRLIRGSQSRTYLEVVGVTRDGHYLSLSEPARPYMFFPALQREGAGVLVVRTAQDPLRMLPAVGRALTEAAPTWEVSNARTMEQQIGESLLPQRIAGTVLTLFGAVALMLVSVGLYGVVAYSVATRTREIGVRIALGAQPGDARRLVVRQSLILTAVGVVLALPIAWVLARLVSGFLIGTSAADPVAFGSAALILGAIAFLASYVPARRASRVDPMVALRAE